MEATHITGRLWMCAKTVGAIVCWACRGLSGTEIFNVHLEWEELAQLARSLQSRQTIWRSQDHSLTLNVDPERLLFVFANPGLQRRAIPLSERPSHPTTAGA